MTAQQLKNSILQMAVQGKLVEQNPDDEPASVLLERIKAEKQELIKTGKIKKGKPLPEITEDEILFDIPDSWEWVRLSQIGETNIGLTYRPSDKTTFGGTLVLRSSNIQNDKMDYTDNVFVSCDIPERAMIHKGDILICARNGSRSLVGKAAVVDPQGFCRLYIDGGNAIFEGLHRHIGGILFIYQYLHRHIGSVLSGFPVIDPVAAEGSV